MAPTRVCLDGNEAAALVAHRLSEVIAIYPITPASPMGELADAWSAEGRTNLWGTVPVVVEMQSEAGAAGTLHGAVQEGALGTTFTASQGLLLMLPDMFKIAGELTPAVIHVAARAVATHALSIFGDHSDVMAARTTGFAMLASGSPQEAHDFALVAHVAALRSRIPFLHFFDGFRTSHELGPVELLDDDDLHALVPVDAVFRHRSRRLDPDHPVVRGTAQNPDVFFQAREAANPFHLAVPELVQETMDALARRTGRAHRLVEYHGSSDADRVIVLMGSAAGAATETVDAMVAAGERVGLVVVRLYRPFPTEQLLAALPPSTRRIGVLDRTKEPGAVGEPLYTDVVAAVAERGPGRFFDRLPDVRGGRYGLASKELTPQMLKGVFNELAAAEPRRHFTVGIVDDVTDTSVRPDVGFRVPAADVRAVVHGLGSDGTVGANKAAVKIVSENSPLHAQGYFVYDSRKSGSATVSHLRFSSRPIRSTYLVDEADFVACHQFSLLDRVDVLATARDGATVLLDSPYPAADVWEHLPAAVRSRIAGAGLDLWVIDAHGLARQLGLGGRINTIMQPCFFALTGLLPVGDAIAAIKGWIRDEYGRAGDAVVDRNITAVDRAVTAMEHVTVPPGEAGSESWALPVPEGAPDFVTRVTSRMLAGEGDLLPVSAMPVDGTFPTGTSRWEKRAIALDLPAWDPGICIDCAKCVIVCPHAAIRMRVVLPDALEGAPGGFLSKPFRSRELPGRHMALQVSPDDCTGCGVCVDVCPVTSKEQEGHKALDMVPARDRREPERRNWEFFLSLPQLDRTLVAHDSVKGSQVLEPLFEFSGACAGCGETPYVKLLTQLFGDRIVVANATGCSSIYGGNLPTTPWRTDSNGRGPAWANSLFEDNAEFGFGIRLALESHADEARRLVEALAPAIGEPLAAELLEAPQDTEADLAAQRTRVARLEHLLRGLDDGDAVRLLSIAGDLVRKSVWIVGGDGWAYDIGFGGLDHVLASGRDVNVLVLDTEVYSNTGGQASKATPRGAVAKFASSGKRTAKKDIGAIARAYGNVYVAQVALGANDVQTVKALLEADAWPGPSIVIAYSTCIAHGIDMSRSMSHQKEAVKSAYWPLYRFRPDDDDHGHPFQLDSHPPSIPLRSFVDAEGRFTSLRREHPGVAEELLALAQADADERWRYYEQLAGMERSVPHPSAYDGAAATAERPAAGGDHGGED